MTLVRYEPWNLLRRFGEDINRLYDDSGVGDLARDDSSRVVTSHWAPAVDIREENERFVLTADIPGVGPKDIEITMDDGVLTVKGERNFEKRDEDAGYSRVERRQGTFYRRFSLPDTADADNISANGNNGVLEIAIPKLAKVQPRRIPVKH